MAVIRLEAVGVINHHKFPIVPGPSRVTNHSIRRSVHRSPYRSRQIDARVEGTLTREWIRSSAERTAQNSINRPQSRLCMRLPLERVSMIDAAEARGLQEIVLFDTFAHFGT